MAPKPRPIQRKMSSASKDSNSASLTKTANAQSMPPPPVPAQAQGIMVPEAKALSGCLRVAAVKTGQIGRFYADTKRLGINRHSPYPPRALVSSLGRELEKYDQLCDAMQSHIQRAIGVLKRDLQREQDRIKAEEEAAVAKAAAEAARAPPNSPVVSPIAELSDGSPSIGSSSSKSTTLPARRQSTISLSSLHRPPFPHKLDLSAATLRLKPDDPMQVLQSGLASPVTLAPRSSISRVPPDFTFGPGEVEIDLTLDDEVPVNMAGSIDPTLGSSADKPIELLDLDMELFGDAVGSDPDPGSSGLNVAGLTGGETGAGTGTGVDTGNGTGSAAKQEEALEFELLRAFEATAPSKADGDLLASLSELGSTGTGGGSRSGAAAGQSPGSLVAGLVGTQDGDNASGGGSQFEMTVDFANIMEGLFSMDGSTGGGGGGGGGGGSGST